MTRWPGSPTGRTSRRRRTSSRRRTRPPTTGSGSGRPIASCRSPATPPSAPRMRGWRPGVCRATTGSSSRSVEPGWSGSGVTSGWPSRRLHWCVPDRSTPPTARASPRRSGSPTRTSSTWRGSTTAPVGWHASSSRRRRSWRAGPTWAPSPTSRSASSGRTPTQPRREPTSRCGRSCRRWVSARTR